MKSAASNQLFFPLLGNLKKSEQLLHKAVESGAVPLQMLEIAIRNLHLQKKQLLSEEDKKSLSGDSQCVLWFAEVKLGFGIL